MGTTILNADECGYKEFMTIGPLIWGFNGARGNQRLHIMRVIVVQDNTSKDESFWCKLGFAPPQFHWKVDLDIYLEDGTQIQVHTTEPKFLKKMEKYIWELQQQRRHVEFYGQNNPQPVGLTEEEKEYIVILTQQIESEKILMRYMIQEREKREARYDWDSAEVQRQQKKILAAEKRIWNLQRQIEKLRAKEV